LDVTDSVSVRDEVDAVTVAFADADAPYEPAATLVLNVYVPAGAVAGTLSVKVTDAVCPTPRDKDALDRFAFQPLGCAEVTAKVLLPQPAESRFVTVTV